MSMVTRCPSCNTMFRVTPQQLQAQQGKVRCGRCMMVFDGFKGLATLPDLAPGESREPSVIDTAAPLQEAVVEEPAAAPSAAAVAPDQPAAGPAAEKALPFEIELPPAFAEFIVEPPEPQAAPSEAQLPAPAAELVPETAPEATPFAAAPQRVTTEDELFGQEAEPEPEPRRGSRIWGLGSVVLLFALAAQAAYFYRSDLAVNYPGLKPVLTQMCVVVGCGVPLPQRPKLINVEASDLQIIDPARPSMIQLTATLRNHAGYDLAYPALDLVLTNSREHTLARRIFMPEEYLERGKNVKSGIPANAEITVHLDLDTGSLGAAGFRLDLLPAPSN